MAFDVAFGVAFGVAKLSSFERTECLGKWPHAVKEGQTLTVL